MSRRRHEQGDAGSDSFLDVLANLVGILVVLVVMTALQAAVSSRTPAEPSPPAEVAAEPAAEPAPDPAPEVVRVPLIAPKPRVIFEQTPAPIVPAGLREAALSAEARTAELRVRLAEATAALGEAERAGAAATMETARILSDAERTTAAVAEAKSAAEEAARDADAARLDRDLWAAKAAAAGDRPPERLEHSALPVGRRVTGTELHFRLAGDPSDPGGGLVRPVPIDALTDRLQADVQRHRDEIVNRGRYEGSVGPMSGYLMNYRIAREGGDVLTRVRTANPSVVRFRMTGWTLENSGADPSVPVAAALREGSDFRFLLATAGPGATVTFWVAPEAFGGFRTLRAAARAAGLSVAARPLPAHIPISGSPHGTRSVAQ